MGWLDIKNITVSAGVVSGVGIQANCRGPGGLRMQSGKRGVIKSKNCLSTQI